MIDCYSYIVEQVMDVLPPVHAQLPACEVVRDQPGDEPPLQQRAADPESITGIALHIHMRLDEAVWTQATPHHQSVALRRL